MINLNDLLWANYGGMRPGASRGPVASPGPMPIQSPVGFRPRPGVPAPVGSAPVRSPLQQSPLGREVAPTGSPFSVHNWLGWEHPRGGF
jgi:hypothetical protein